MLLFELKNCAKVRFVCSMGFALNIFSYFVKDSLIYLLQRGVVLTKSTDIAFNLLVGTSLRYQKCLRNWRKIQRGMVDQKLFHWQTKLLVSRLVVHGYVFEISFWQLLCRVCELFHWQTKLLVSSFVVHGYVLIGSKLMLRWISINCGCLSVQVYREII